MIFNRNLLKIRRDIIANSTNDSFLLNFASDDIMSKVSDLDINPKNILDIGARNGNVTNLLASKFNKSNLFATEISSNMLMNNIAPHKTLLDEESICDYKPGVSFDLIVSCINLHWINDLMHVLRHICSMLSREGVFVCNFFTGITLQNLKLWLIKYNNLNSFFVRRIAPFVRYEDVYKIFQSTGFKTIISENNQIEVEYAKIMTLVNDLRNIAEVSILDTVESRIADRSIVTKMQDFGIKEDFFITTVVASASNLKML